MDGTEIGDKQKLDSSNPKPTSVGRKQGEECEEAHASLGNEHNSQIRELRGQGIVRQVWPHTYAIPAPLSGEGADIVDPAVC